MLISEIIALAEAQCDESYSSSEWVDLINTCFDDLSPAAKNLVNVTGKTVIVSGGKASITMSSDSDLTETQEVRAVYYTPENGSKTRLRKLSPSDMYSKGWKLEADKVILQGVGSEESGEIDFDIYKNIPHIVYDSEEETFIPESPPAPLRSQYHPLIVSWLCMKSQQREEESEVIQDFNSEYMIGKQVFAEDRLKEMEPGQYYLVYKRATNQSQSQ